MPAVRQPFPTYPLCPVCGDPACNPLALGMRWYYDHATARVVGTFVAGACHTGYADTLHGGLLASLLDECLAWACAVARRTYFVTGELTVRYRAAAPLGVPMEVFGAAGEARGPYVRATGGARLADGTLAATAVGTFAAMPRERALHLRQALHVSPGDLDVLAGAST